MVAYFDTSVLIPLFFNETGTAAGRLCETTKEHTEAKRSATPPA